MKRIFSALLIIVSVPFFYSCSSFWDDSIDPELKKQRDAYYTVIEAHALKQVWMYNYFKTFSNNYSRGELFVYEPTQAELDAFLGQLAELMTYSDAVDSAIYTIRNAQNNMATTSDALTLKSVSGLFDSMAAFYTWGKNAGQRARDRTMLIVSNLSPAQKSQLFNDLLRDSWKKEFKNEAEFWTKLEKGELDDRSPQIYNDFYYNSSYTIDNIFVTLANDKGLTPGKIVAKEGAEGIEKGAAVYVEAVKTATPLGKGIDVLENGRKWWEKAETAVDKPLEFVGDEVQKRLAKKLGSFVDVDGAIDAAGLSATTGFVAKGLMELSLGSDNPSDIIEKGLEWGIAKISSPKKTIAPEVIFAEKNSLSTGFPDIVLGIGNYVNNLGETLVALPKGNWNLTAIDAKGNSAKVENVALANGQYTPVSIEKQTDGKDSENNNDPDETGCDSLNIHADIIKYIHFELNTGEQSFNIENKGYKNPEGWSEVKGLHNYFTTQFDYSYVESNTEYNNKLFIEGKINTDGLGKVLLTMSLNSIFESYNNDTKQKLSKNEVDILVKDLPAILPWYNCVCGGNNGLCKYNFGISGTANSYLWNNMGSIVSFNYKYSTYSLNNEGKEVETVREEKNQIINNKNQYILIRLSGN